MKKRALAGVSLDHHCDPANHPDPGLDPMPELAGRVAGATIRAGVCPPIRERPRFPIADLLVQRVVLTQAGDEPHLALAEPGEELVIGIASVDSQ